MASPEAIAKHRDRIVRVLATPACAEIRFKLADVRIYRLRYNYLAGLVQADKVHVDFGGPRYDYKSKTILLDEGEWDATVVHESTHALINISHAGETLTNGVHEASAYVAEALWALNAGRDVAIDVPHVDIQATRVARKIKDFNARNPVGLYEVEPADYVNIQTLLKISKNGTDVDSKYVQVGVCDDK
jgi:hypothetical protein